MSNNQNTIIKKFNLTSLFDYWKLKFVICLFLVSWLADYGKIQDTRYNNQKFRNFKFGYWNFKFVICLVFVSCFLIIASYETNAGTIIKSPAYLGLQRGLVGCWSFDGDYTNVPDCSD